MPQRHRVANGVATAAGAVVAVKAAAMRPHKTKSRRARCQLLQTLWSQIRTNQLRPTTNRQMTLALPSQPTPLDRKPLANAAAVTVTAVTAAPVVRLRLHPRTQRPYQKPTR
jgi:hypothetical protein